MPAKKFVCLAGKKIGILTVKSFAGEEKQHGLKPIKNKQGGYWKPPSRIIYMWTCECECGTVKDLSYTYLTHKRRKHVIPSCGCLSYSPAKLVRGKTDTHMGFVDLYCRYRAKAAKRGFPFDLSREMAKHLFESHCFYCGIQPSQAVRRGSRDGCFFYNGIDRIDSTLGYTEDNCVPCCKVCNRAKSTMGVMEFLAWAQRIAFNSKALTVQLQIKSPFSQKVAALANQKKAIVHALRPLQQPLLL